MIRLAILTLVAALTASTALPAQATLNVPAQYGTVQGAINAAVTGDTVLVAPGTYTGAVNFLGKAITVRGSQGAAATALTQPSGRAVSFISGEGSAAVLEGLTITGGGGGVLCQGSSPTIRGCVISNSTGAQTGGGIRIVADQFQVSSPSIEDCRIELNSVIDIGAGVAVEVNNGTANPTFRRCVIANNVALSVYNTGDGGGMSFLAQGGSCQPIIEDCVVSGNSTIDRGGGIGFTQSTGTVSRCEIRNNHSGGAGGGIYCSQSAVTIENCMVLDNTSSSTAVSLSSGSPSVVRHCTIAGNTSTGSTNVGLATGQNAIIEHTIIWNSAGTAVTQNWTGSNLAMNWCNYSSAFLLSGQPTNMSIDPLFVDPANGDYHLSPQSPCVDAGDPAASSLPLLDFDGDPRVSGARVDIGADEVLAASMPGTGEDLALYTWIGGGGDPNANTASAAPGESIVTRIMSPDGLLVGAPALLVAQGFTTGAPPAPNPGLGAVHINLLSPYTVLSGTLSPAPFPVAGLPTTGTDVAMLVPPGLTGNSARLQAFAVTAVAANGQYAATRAHDIDFQ